MNSRDYVSPIAYQEILEKIRKRERFEYKAKAGSKTVVSLNLHAEYIDQDLADQIWAGDDYLVHFQLDYRGEAGIGGMGYAMNELQYTDKIASYSAFRAWLDNHLRRFKEFEEEQEQYSLFDI